MTYQLPPLPPTDWLLHMPAREYEPEWTSSQEGYSADDMLRYAREAIDSVLAAEYQREQIASAQSEAAFKANQEAYR